MPISKPEAKVDITKDTVCYQGKRLPMNPMCLLYVKQTGHCVWQSKTICIRPSFSFIEKSKGYNLFPVGRLDLDTEGLLLITNDGTLAHELLSPKSM